jgi:hypothetical protein
VIRSAALIVGVVLACLGTCPLHAETITFERDVVGIPPSDFDSWGTGDAGPGLWAVVHDDSSQSVHALEQYRRDPTEQRVALAIYKPFTGDNLEVTIRFKAVSGSLDQSAGIAVQLTTPDDYYVACASVMGQDVRIYRVANGKFLELARANASVTLKEWHTLALKVDGDRFLVALDGLPTLAATDQAMHSPGKVALWTKADSVTRFDQLNVKSLH